LGDARSQSETAPDKAKAIADFAGRYGGIFDKAFVGVDHYVGKYMFTVLEYIRAAPEFAEVINDANTIIFQFLENEIDIPRSRQCFARIGIIADMMPHVLALLMKIYGPAVGVSKTGVLSWRMNSYDEMCKAARIEDKKETHAEIELRISEHRHADRTAIVRIGKGVGVEERKVAFVDSRGHIIEMELPFTVHGSGKSGRVVLKTPGRTIELRPPELSLAELSAEAWDKAWYNVIRGLMSMELRKPPEIFLGIQDAQKIVSIIEDLKR
jgi:hypothetical protein